MLDHPDFGAPLPRVMVAQPGHPFDHDIVIKVFNYEPRPGNKVVLDQALADPADLVLRDVGLDLLTTLSPNDPNRSAYPAPNALHSSTSGQSADYDSFDIKLSRSNLLHACKQWQARATSENVLAQDRPATTSDLANLTAVAAIPEMQSCLAEALGGEPGIMPRPTLKDRVMATFGRGREQSLGDQVLRSTRLNRPGL